MQIVIDIPDEVYKELTETAIIVTEVYPLTIDRALTEGKPYEERKTGRWIRRHSKMWECSECERGCRWRENYCPDCGAKMEVDE